MFTASIDIRLFVLKLLENLSYYYALASYCVFQANDHLDVQYAQKHFALKDFSPNMQDPIVMPSRLNAKLVVKVGVLHNIICQHYTAISYCQAKFS